MKLTRREAIDNKDKFYMTGKPCKFGHYAKRDARDGSCYVCRLANQRETRKSVSVF